MGKELSFWERLGEEAELSEEPMPGKCLVEILEDRRVLIENHQGICGYGPEKILVKVKFGQLCISGQGLLLRKMTRSQLVITGSIHCVSVSRRRAP